MAYPAANAFYYPTVPQAYWPAAPAAYPQTVYAAPVVVPAIAAPMSADTLTLSPQATAAAPAAMTQVFGQLAAAADQIEAAAQPAVTPPSPPPANPTAPTMNPLGVEWVSAAPAKPANAGNALDVQWQDAPGAKASASSAPLDIDWKSMATPSQSPPQAAAPKPETAPAPKPAPAPAPKPAPAPALTVTVQSGDSLSGIAARTLGSADRWREIYDLNRDQLANPNVIHAGQVLKLPGGAKPSAPAPTTARTGINTNRSQIFIQQPNNWTCGPTSLTMAAAAWGIRPANLATINELTTKTRTNPAYGIPDSNAIPNAARAIGLQAKFHSSSTPDSIRAVLRSGHGVILNGSISGRVGHFIYVAGLNADGSFKICDPFRPGITAWNDAQLRQFTTGRGSMVEIWK